MQAADIHVSPADLRRVVFASVLGNGLEWFDFISYAYFAGIISQVFFPASPFISLVLTFSAFAVGFVVRPLGGVLLGLYADRRGRRPALILLIGMMAIGTLTIGVTPSFATIGFAAPLIVVIGRIIQGLSIGGEFASATTMLVEHVGPERRMMFGSFQMSAQALGRVLASAFGLMLTFLVPPTVLHDWAWRLPFIAGAAIGPFGIYVRMRMTESPEFQRLQNSVKASAQPPLRTALGQYVPAIICGIGIVVISTALTYIWNNYFPVYVVRHLHLPLWQDLFGVLITSAIDIPVCVLGGWLADRYGAYRMFFGLTVLSGVLAYPLLAFVLAAPSGVRLFVAQLVALTIMGLVTGPGPGMLAALFPVELRSTGMAITYNIAVTIFGGFAPLTMTWIIHTTHDNLSPAYYIAAAAILSIVLVGTTMSFARRRPSRREQATQST
jgi:MHS family proline/betaine transporter-like MFS transporter